MRISPGRFRYFGALDSKRRAAAEAVYSGEWCERVEQLYGAKPVIAWFDTPVIVDNLAGGAIIKAA